MILHLILHLGEYEVPLGKSPANKIFRSMEFGRDVLNHVNLVSGLERT